MTYEALETELDTIIEETKAEIESEEMGTKSATIRCLKDD